MDLGGKGGFNKDLISNSIDQVRSEALAILSSFTEGLTVNVVEDYQDSRWQNAVA